MAICTGCGSDEGLYLYNTGRLAPKPLSLPQALTTVFPGEVYLLVHPACGWRVSGIINHGFLLPFLDAEPIQELRGADVEAA